MQGTSITHVAATPSFVQKLSRISFPRRSRLLGGDRNVSGRTSSFSLSAIRPDEIEPSYRMFDLKVYRKKKKGKTDSESDEVWPITPGDVIVGRYKILEIISDWHNAPVYQALDLEDNTEVCVKLMGYIPTVFEGGMNEIEMLKFINSLDPDDEQGVVRLLDSFFYNGELLLVFELLRINLHWLQHECLKICPDITSEYYFLGLEKIKIIAQQLVKTLSYLHSLDVIHADIEPGNVLVKDYASCTVKLIDFEMSCFASEDLCHHIQTMPYQAPEVGLGLQYDQKVDMWSLGCIMVELYTGELLFKTKSFEELILKIVNMRGPVPEWMIKDGKYAHQYYSSSGEMLRRSFSGNHSHTSESSQATCTLWGQRGPPSDEAFQDFVSQLLTIDPTKRPTAQEISQRPWLKQNYEE